VVNLLDYIFLSVPQSGPRKFIRATPFHSANETCTSRLKRYRFAALLYAYDHYLTGSDGVDLLQRRMYMKSGDLYCPLGGTYVSGGAVLMNVVCTIPGHSIQDQ